MLKLVYNKIRIGYPYSARPAKAATRLVVPAAGFFGFAGMSGGGAKRIDRIVLSRIVFASVFDVVFTNRF